MMRDKTYKLLIATIASIIVVFSFSIIPRAAQFSIIPGATQSNSSTWKLARPNQTITFSPSYYVGDDEANYVAELKVGCEILGYMNYSIGEIDLSISIKADILPQYRSDPRLGIGLIAFNPVETVNPSYSKIFYPEVTTVNMANLNNLPIQPSSGVAPTPGAITWIGYYNGPGSLTQNAACVIDMEWLIQNGAGVTEWQIQLQTQMIVVDYGQHTASYVSTILTLDIHIPTSGNDSDPKPELRATDESSFGRESLSLSSLEKRLEVEICVVRDLRPSFFHFEGFESFLIEGKV
jgi:hypothetical protein